MRLTKKLKNAEKQTQCSKEWGQLLSQCSFAKRAFILQTWVTPLLSHQSPSHLSTLEGPQSGSREIKYWLLSSRSGGKDPQKNVLVRTVGFEESVEIDVFRYKVSKNDIFLICSDGLHGKVSDADILYLVNQYIPDPSQTKPDDVSRAAEALVDQANKNGGQDNISVIIVVAQ